MHSSATRTEFLRLRIAGLSFARIARQLGVSKPTLIAWSRQCRNDLRQAEQPEQHDLKNATTEELAAITKRYEALQQELFSRSLCEIPTECLETIAGKLRDRLEHLKSICSNRRKEALKFRKERHESNELPDTASLSSSGGEGR